MVLLAFSQVSSDGASLDVICPLRDLNQNFIQSQTVIRIKMIFGFKSWDISKGRMHQQQDQMASKPAHFGHP